MAAVVDGELGEGCGYGAAVAGAMELAVAVAGETGDAGAVVSAAGASPDSAGPVVGGGRE